jgi:hypothetical protein
MKFLIMVLALFVSSSNLASAADVPNIDVCGSLVSKGRMWNGSERLERVLDVRGQKINVAEFVLRYCQSGDAKKTDTCSRALKVGSLELVEVRRNMPNGLCASS